MGVKTPTFRLSRQISAPGQRANPSFKAGTKLSLRASGNLYLPGQTPDHLILLWQAMDIDIAYSLGSIDYQPKYFKAEYSSGSALGRLSLLPLSETEFSKTFKLSKAESTRDKDRAGEVYIFFNLLNPLNPLASLKP